LCQRGASRFKSSAVLDRRDQRLSARILDERPFRGDNKNTSLPVDRLEQFATPTCDATS
jgi:hypothetical protein